MATVKDVLVRKANKEDSKRCGSWPLWTCGVSKFDWDYTQKEKCLLLEGKVTVADRPDSGNSVSFGAGDYVEFPVGLKCTWKVAMPVKKHYDFE